MEEREIAEDTCEICREAEGRRVYPSREWGQTELLVKESRLCSDCLAEHYDRKFCSLHNCPVTLPESNPDRCMDHAPNPLEAARAAKKDSTRVQSQGDYYDYRTGKVGYADTGD